MLKKVECLHRFWVSAFVAVLLEMTINLLGHPFSPNPQSFPNRQRTKGNGINSFKHPSCLHFYLIPPQFSIPFDRVFPQLCLLPPPSMLILLVAVVTNCGTPVPLTLPSSLCSVLCVCVCACVHCMYTQTNVYMRVSAGMYVRLCVCTCVYARRVSCCRQKGAE